MSERKQKQIVDKQEIIEEKKGKVESIFDDDFDDSIEFFSANGKKSQVKKEVRSSVDDLRQELQQERIKQEKETERREKEKTEHDEKPAKASPFDDEILKSFDTSEVSGKTVKDALEEDSKELSGASNFDGLFGEGDEDDVGIDDGRKVEEKRKKSPASPFGAVASSINVQESSVEEEAEEIIMEVSEISQDAEIEYNETDFASPEIMDNEEVSLELDEFGEVVEISTVAEEIDSMLQKTGEKYDEFVNDTKIINE